MYGADGQREGGGQGSYFVTIAKNLTVDGWVVIGICMAMLVIALIIMVLKAFFLSPRRTCQPQVPARFPASERRSDALDDERRRTTRLDERPRWPRSPSDRQYGASTLYRLYHHGVRGAEQAHRGQTVARSVSQMLSPQSIEAIRASMDATHTRLQQRLSSQMVLLTIAISGGPFLGLLGTVIGVMITFAAIALSGDVNINAIAPGTAAALAATVAGLASRFPPVRLQLAQHPHQVDQCQ